MQTKLHWVKVTLLLKEAAVHAMSLKICGYYELADSIFVFVLQRSIVSDSSRDGGTFSLNVAVYKVGRVSIR